MFWVCFTTHWMFFLLNMEQPVGYVRAISDYNEGASAGQKTMLRGESPGCHLRFHAFTSSWWRWRAQAGTCWGRHGISAGLPWATGAGTAPWPQVTRVPRADNLGLHLKHVWDAPADANSSSSCWLFHWLAQERNSWAPTRRSSGGL